MNNNNHGWKETHPALLTEKELLGLKTALLDGIDNDPNNAEELREILEYIDRASKN